MERRRIVVVMGTRPEAIKLAPVVHELRSRSDALDTLVVATAQHREMLDQVLALFQIRPDYDLNLMQYDQSLSDLTARLLHALDQTLKRLRPDLLLVQGDTTTVFTAALAAFYNKIAVGHVEAGLRSDDRYNPFPEEINRRVTTALTEFHFAPTPLAKRRLLREGVPAERIVVTGNTVVDALSRILQGAFDLSTTPLGKLPLDNHRLLFVTSHRRESWGEALENICLALAEIVSAFPDVIIVYPVHPNPNVRSTVESLLSHKERIYLFDPFDYLTTLNLIQRSYLVLTDSGGIQEEAPTLNKPVLVLRQTTERPEACMAGLAKLVGTSRQAIVTETARLLTNPSAYRAMTNGANPFGDGRASARIVDALERWARGKQPLLVSEAQFCPAA